MRHINILLLIVSIITLSACAKAGQEVAEELGIIPSTCGSDGARVQAEVDGSSFCGDAQIIAMSDGHSATVSGIALLGNTLSLQLDTLGVGTYTISEADNAVLYLSGGTPYTTDSDSAGSVIITGHDGAAHRLKATFQARVRNEMSGSSKAISGSLDVTYSVNP
ncbi:MAG: hypothetical protein JNM62_15305 [Flavobacteriales bacterium]|nr:hypothetical protein [Flavobacteriales bacterium]